VAQVHRCACSLSDITSHGERNLLVLTANNVDEPRNQSVEFTIR
jgi:hypothetical protein